MGQQLCFWVFTEGNETTDWNDIDTSMFIAALLTRAHTWKQQRYPPKGEWIKKMLSRCVCVCVYYTFHGILFSHKKIRKSCHFYIWESQHTLSQHRLTLKVLTLRDIKGTFHAKMGTIKDRNGTDLTEAEDIKKRWQEYTEELTEKILRQIIMMMWSLT